MAGIVVVHTQLLRDPKTGFWVVLQKTEEVTTLHKTDFTDFTGCSTKFVRAAGNCRAEPQSFSRLSDVQDESLSIHRRKRQLNASFAEHEKAACHLPFKKQNLVFRIEVRNLDPLKVL